MTTAIRWQQRFQNYQSSLRVLRQACTQTEYSDLERAGLIQLFEVTFELGWKTLKDLLNHGGYDVKSPREVLKQAFADSLVADGEGWILALDGRNKFAHIYNEGIAKAAVAEITGRYLAMLVALETTLAARLRPHA
ncbi:MAG: nucleotidyltransferase substrate binding protein [Planctomycetes bacterium]|nr:nucleotidyltransferase substrate binding protein [Planctomycetota bacterium]